jgi:glyoxylase-like metal-dependent hydrolase (beta-lactamase superfamily II)
MQQLSEVAPGLWRWALPHPSWRAGEFSREVVSWAARAGEDMLLVDPLLPDSDESFLDPIVAGRVAVLVTIPYHARSSETLAARYDAPVYGHPATAKRFGEPSRLRPMDPSTPLPGGARCFAIGRPRRYEQPVHLPSHRALVFGDAVVVTPSGELRVWAQEPPREAWYRERFLPTLEPLLDLDVERILVTHGAPVLSGGREALRAALQAPPWLHHG